MPGTDGKVLITGGSGFIARHLVLRLLSEGREVCILDLFEPPPELAAVSFVQGDVRDPGAARTALGGCDEVFHLAAAHHDYGLSRDTFFSVNETGMRVLCEAMRDQGVSRICFTSTVAVFGDAPGPHVEGAPPHPVTPYGESKLAAERVLEDWVLAAPNRHALILRPTVVFGPHNFANMFALIRQIRRGLFLQVGDGANVKSVAYVENLVDAALQLWTRADAAPFEVFNIADKPDLTSRQIAEVIFAALGRRPSPVHIPLAAAVAAAWPFDLVSALTGRPLPVSRQRVRKFAAMETRYESDKLLATGFRARLSIEEGLRRTVEWFLREGERAIPRVHLPPATVGGPQ